MEDYSVLDNEALCKMLHYKQNTINMYQKRIDECVEVIDAVAEYIGIADKGFFLYGVQGDGTNPILDEIKKYLDNGGDKAKLKRRIAELETENSVLRTLIRK